MLIEVSDGELFDKYLILCLKAAKVDHGSVEQRYVEYELKALTTPVERILQKHDIHDVVDQLYDINSSLWDLEDAVRKSGLSDTELGRLARQIFQLNDQRSRVKKQINVHTGSAMQEVKVRAEACN